MNATALDSLVALEALLDIKRRVKENILAAPRVCPSSDKNLDLSSAIKYNNPIRQTTSTSSKLKEAVATQKKVVHFNQYTVDESNNIPIVKDRSSSLIHPIKTTTKPESPSEAGMRDMPSNCTKLCSFSCDKNPVPLLSTQTGQNLVTKQLKISAKYQEMQKGESVIPCVPTNSAKKKERNSKMCTSLGIENDDIHNSKVETALHSKNQRGRKRENLSALERLELTRTRNREHAKTTRIRKKARFQELMTYEMKYQQSAEIESIRRIRCESILKLIQIRSDMHHVDAHEDLNKLCSQHLDITDFSAFSSLQNFVSHTIYFCIPLILTKYQVWCRCYAPTRF